MSSKASEAGGTTGNESAGLPEMDGRHRKFIMELQKTARARRESGLYVVDGPKMAGELAHADVEELYVTKSFLGSAAAAECAGLLKEVPYSLVQDSEMKQLSDTVTPQGILAVVRQRRIRGIRELLAGDRAEAVLLLMLETIQDPGNLGTIFRMAEAAGVTAILMNRETADAYAPKVVRATMGALLRVPFLYVEDLERAAEGLAAGAYSDGRPVHLYAAAPLGAEDYACMDYRQDAAFLIGNESRGLSAALLDKAEHRVLIPMKGRAESLNAAVAASVLCFEAARQRRTTGV